MSSSHSMLKKIAFPFIFLFYSHSIVAQQKQVNTSKKKCLEYDWKLAFEDNFEGTQLNFNVWKMREYAQGSFEQDQSEEYYTFDNVKVENGICKLIPKKETVVRKAVNWQPDTMKLGDGISNTRTYYHTSGWIETKEKFYYGKYEIRCKIPKGKGLWPAFWMYGEKNKINNEIDVFEFWNPENNFGQYIPKKLSMVHHITVHHNHKMSGKKYVGPDYSLAYHTFTVVWDSTKIEWYVDGKLQRLVTQYITKRGKAVLCNEMKTSQEYMLNPVFPIGPMTIIADIAIQSKKNSPDENTFNNPALEIDYIRYYQLVPK
jgi:beta-glucanase (GH16 family)